MRYEKIVKGTFIERPNRFIAKVNIESKIETAHVKNTGRCKELLVPGATVYLQYHRGEMGERKTKFSLVAVEKEDKLINMDSSAPNKVVEEALLKMSIFDDLSDLLREQRFGDSRLDFYYERAGEIKGYLEVKGVTLEENGMAMFPDAKTERGVKHVNELINALEAGYESTLIFVIQFKDVHNFTPNEAAHPEFAKALREASKKGVRLFAYNCAVTPSSLNLSDSIPILL